MPDFGMPDAMPHIPHEVYQSRLARLRTQMAAAGYERLVVFADREHSVNLAYLTGFDPRFEETMLIVDPHRGPLILVGKERVGMAETAPLDMRVEVLQDFSLHASPGTGRDPCRRS
ncbi:MAG: hypothetical protein GY926_24330 [bacterium]|nr:hypothetical protein [bacterium]MCP4968347.1 hypothetical protein [bacterium]